MRIVDMAHLGSRLIKSMSQTPTVLNWKIVCLVTPFVLYFTALTMSGLLGLGGLWMNTSILALMPLILVVVGAVLWWFLFAKRLRRRLAVSGGKLCVRCTFDLRGIGNHGVCPECGLSFDVEQTVQAWVASGLHIPDVDGRRSNK